jgi:hypothetical protein
MKPRSALAWTVRVIASVSLIVLGWYAGTELGAVVSVWLDSGDTTGFVSSGLMTIPLFGLAGSVAGVVGAYLILRRNPR